MVLDSVTSAFDVGREVWGSPSIRRSEIDGKAHCGLTYGIGIGGGDSGIGKPEIRRCEAGGTLAPPALSKVWEDRAEGRSGR